MSSDCVLPRFGEHICEYLSKARSRLQTDDTFYEKPGAAFSYPVLRAPDPIRTSFRYSVRKL